MGGERAPVLARTCVPTGAIGRRSETQDGSETPGGAWARGRGGTTDGAGKAMQGGGACGGQGLAKAVAGNACMHSSVQGVHVCCVVQGARREGEAAWPGAGRRAEVPCTVKGRTQSGGRCGPQIRALAAPCPPGAYLASAGAAVGPPARPPDCPPPPFLRAASPARLGHSTRHFNVGQYRRQQRGSAEVQDAAFFDHANPVSHAGAVVPPTPTPNPPWHGMLAAPGEAPRMWAGWVAPLCWP